MAVHPVEGDRARRAPRRPARPARQGRGLPVAGGVGRARSGRLVEPVPGRELRWRGRRFAGAPVHGV